jgi:hypothetical protein
VHVVPQAPQFARSAWVSTQVPLQFVWPLMQPWRQTPSWQAWPIGHAVPQAPQFERSLCSVTHCPLQRVVPMGHGWGFGSTTHRLATHEKPVGQGGSSGVPQKYTVVREQPASDSPSVAHASARKRKDDVMGAVVRRVNRP